MKPATKGTHPNKSATKAAQKSHAAAADHADKAPGKRSASAGHSEHGEHHRGPHGKGPEVPVPEDRPAIASLPPDLAAARQAMDLVRQHKFADATTRAAGSGDPVARKVVEWALLRASDGDVPFERYAAFIGENPDWPGVALFRRQAEARLWYDRRDPATVRRFLGGEPASALGRLALARQLKSEGDRAGAAREVRAVWQTAELSPDLEIATLDAFRDELTPDDHAARMDWRIGARDFGGAARAARHLGDEATAIVKACAAADSGAAKARAQFAEVSGEARGDPGFVLCQVRFLQREDPAGAAQFLLSVTPESLARQDADAWWRERRLLSRRLIDIGDPKTAYRVVHEAAVPSNPYYRSEYHFMAGWIALRWL